MLLGRERERQELERGLAGARAGTSAVLALVGEPGIGKTALLRFAEERALDMNVLHVRGVESEARIPFGALLELLRPALGLLKQIPGPQAEALGVALALRPGKGRDRFSVGAATLSLLAAYAEAAPTLVLVDDAHWLDAASGESLLFAVRRLLAEPICVLLAARSGQPSLLDGSGLATITLAGLEREEVQELLHTLAPPIADRVYASSGGNPLALRELARDASAVAVGPAGLPLPVPDAISHVFWRRVDGLDAPARQLLLLIAAADGAEIAVLERAAASSSIAMEVLGEVEGTGLVRVADGRVDFNHPLGRSAIYTRSAPQARREAHRALAGAMPDRDRDRRAWHLALACVGTDGAAAAALEGAASRAARRGGYAEAAAAYERSAELLTDDERRAELLLAAAEAFWSAGFAEHAEELLERAARLDADGRMGVRGDHLRGRIAVRRGPVMSGYRLLSAAAERAAEFDEELAVRIFAEAIDACYYSGDARAMRHASDRIAALLHGTESANARFLALVARGMALVFAGEGEAGIAHIRDGVALAEESHELSTDAHMLPWLIMGPLWLRELDAGRELVEVAIENARARVSLGVLPWLLARVGRSHAGTDDWTAAEVEYDEAIRLARETTQRVELAASLAGLSWLEARLGRDRDCREHAAEAKALCEELEVGLFEGWTLRALGELELGFGHADLAAEQFERLESHLDRLGVGDVDVSPAAELVDCYLRMGRREEAAAAGARLQSRAREKGQPWSLARAQRCRGLLAEERFEPHFEEALRLHELTPDVFEQAITRLGFGARLRRDRQRRRAREQLRAALEIFERLGAVKLYEAGEAELRATGETARRRDVSTIDQLTPQELHIARLLAEGRTTREAAAAVFLSPKTIEYHLRSVYRKLGVNSRPELRAALSAVPGSGYQAGGADLTA